MWRNVNGFKISIPPKPTLYAFDVDVDVDHLDYTLSYVDFNLNKTVTVK